MNSNPRRREDFRKQQRGLTHNQSLAASMKTKSKGSMLSRVLSIVAVLLVSFGLAWAAHMYFTVHNAIDGASENHSATSSRIANRQPISVLVLGVDQGIEGRHEQGNSDTLILGTLNPQKQKATMTSIPRDTLTEIKGDPDNKYFMFRVNSAYEVGGNQAAVKTISTLLNVPINYYLEVNMKALRSLVNAVGGVDVHVPFSFSYDWCDFYKGEQHLNGRHAVAYVRMRKQDPRGDYGRQLRQRQVIEAVAHKAMSVNTLKNYRSLVEIFNKYVKTNLTFNDMFALALNYRTCTRHVNSGYIQGHDAWINGSSLQVASTPVLQKTSDLIRTNLNLNKITLNNEETRQNRLNDENNHLKWSDPNAFENYQIFNANSDTPEGGTSSGNSNSQTDSNSQNGPSNKSQSNQPAQKVKKWFQIFK